jgi:hypothetical protein
MSEPTFASIHPLFWAMKEEKNLGKHFVQFGLTFPLHLLLFGFTESGHCNFLFHQFPRL